MKRKPIETSWAVSLEQKRPYETTTLEVFEEEDDALHFAETWAKGHGSVKLTKRSWRLPGDGQFLVVRKKWNI